MNFRYLTVKPELADYVRTILVLENNTAVENQDLPLFTKGTAALIYQEAGDKYQITLFGESVPDEIFDGNKTIIAFFFKPFALGSLFKLPAKTFRQPVTLNLWNAQKAMALEMQFHRATSTEEKLEILNHFIGSQLQVNKRDCEIIRYATDRFMENPGTEMNAALLDELNLTERTFQRIFKKYVGVTPNEYRRICQFYFAFSQLKGGHFESQTDVAYSNGYFDQSHYIRSFREFTETTPNEYLQNGLPKK